MGSPVTRGRLVVALLLWIAMTRGALAAPPPAATPARSLPPAEIHFVEDQAEQRPVLFVPRVGGAPPRLDGVLDDAAWGSGLVAEDFRLGWGAPAPHATAMRATWDRQHLYLAATCAIDPAKGLRHGAPAGSRDQKVWTGDCIDFRIAVNEVRYQFLVGASGAVADLKQDDIAWDADWQAKAVVGEGAYVVELAIPLEAIGLAAEDGIRFVMDFARLDAAVGPEAMVSLTPPFGQMDRAPIFVIGSAGQEARLVGRTSDFGVGDVELFMDRVQYPDFAPVATGRLTMQSQPQHRLGSPLVIAMEVRRGEEVLLAQRIAEVKSPTLDFDLPIADLPVGDYTLGFRFLEGEKVLGSAERNFTVEPQEAQTRGEIGITIPAAPVELDAYPVTFGVPFPWGALFSPEQVRLFDAAGGEIPIQAEITARWTKRGSVRWLLIDAVVPMRTTAQQYRLRYDGEPRPAVRDPVRVERTTVADGRAALLVDTGRLRFEVPTTHTPGIARLWENGRLVAEAQGGDGAYLVDASGAVYLGSNDPEPEVVVESAGPLKAAIRITGWHVSDKGRRGKYVLRYVAHAGLPFVQVSHTFIVTDDADVRYRDIGYAFPARSSAGVLGTPRITPFRLDDEDANAYLLQRDDRNSEVYVNGKFVDEAGKSDGWASNHQVTLTVRDFWRQYPKEIEMTPRQMIAHAWPAHNPPARHGPERVTLHNLHRFWFVHEGPVLDFTPPDWFVTLAASEDEPYAASMTKASPMGMAKTHDLLLHFHALNWDQARARSVGRVFQWNPAVICDSKWVCASGALGPIHPRDAEQFPQFEAASDGMIQAILRQQQQDFDTGMFNLGDAHHAWNKVERRWEVHRLWRATHHHWPRWPWVQFARRGEKAVLDYARRNGRHVADISHCHYADADARAAAYPAGKLVGGITDYKGIVHWNAGNRLGYNCVGDALLNAYYFTGDHRSLAAAMAHAAALAADGRALTGREGSARVVSGLALYQHTWDNALLAMVERTIDRYAMYQRPDGSFDNYLSSWAPHLRRYTEVTGNPRGIAILRRYGDWILSDPAKYVRSIYLFGLLDTLATLDLYMDDPRYLAAAAWRASAVTGAVYEGDDARFRGAPTWTRNMHWSWFLTEGPVYAAAAARHATPIAPMTMPSGQAVRVLVREQIDGEAWWVFRARVRQARDTPLVIELDARGEGLALDVQPIGGEAVSFEAAPGEPGAQRLLAEVAPDGILDYAVRVRAKEDFVLPLPLARDSEVKEVYRLARAYVAGGPRYWLDLPADASRFSAMYAGDDGVSVVEVFRPDGQRAYRDVFYAPNGPGAFDLPVTGETRGWSFRVVGNQGDGHGALLTPGAEPSRAEALWFAVSREKFFWPE